MEKTGFEFYLDAVEKQIRFIRTTQREGIEKCAVLFADCFAKNGLVQLVGIGNCRALPMELGYRAGGLMPFHRYDQTDLALRGVLPESQIETEEFAKHEAYAAMWTKIYNVDPNDIYLFSSLDGTEPVLVELALQAKKEGRVVISIVNVKAAQNASAKHSSGKKLHEISDLVLDTDVSDPDTVLDLDGVHRAAQLNTISGNVIGQMITAETYRYLKNHGQNAPVLLSVNIKGADAHNRKLSDVYKGRWNS